MKQSALKQAEILIEEIIGSDNLTPCVEDRVLKLDTMVEKVRQEAWLDGYDEGLRDGENINYER